ncbi:MAG: hypothetical protein JJT76_14695 [Clostridiaceae bacterium]|nr:hypothetical protein [Clostridiaceae bacterium]
MLSLLVTTDEKDAINNYVIERRNGGKYMKCPYCHRKMEKGCISGDRYSLKWIEESRYKPFLSQFQKGIKLTHGIGTLNDLETYFCKDCEKMIIDVSDKPK